MLARFIPGSPAADAPRLDPLIDRLRADVVRLSVPRNIHAQPEANAATRAELARRLRALGCEVHEQSEHRNLIALPPASRRGPEPLPVIAAHYDSVAATPGADDNASALAVCLELARRAAELDRPLAVIAFNAEEEWMLGSAAFVDEYAAIGERLGVALDGVHVLEMVGFTGGEQRLPPGGAELLGALGVEAPARGDFVLLVANAGSVGMLERALATVDDATDDERPAVLGLGLPPDAEALVPDLQRSDHGPFWRAGLPAMMWTDTAELRNPNYHAVTDTPETLDYVFMARVCELLGRVVGLAPRATAR